MVEASTRLEGSIPDLVGPRMYAFVSMQNNIMQ